MISGPIGTREDEPAGRRVQERRKCEEIGVTVPTKIVPKKRERE